MKIKRAFAVAILLTLLSVFARPANATINSTIYAVQNGLIKLTSPGYEIAFSEVDGGIAYITDKATKQKISSGSSDGSLWSAAFNAGTPVATTAYKDHFKYDWNADNKTLTLTYDGPVGVTVTAVVSGDHALKLQAEVTNGGTAVMTNFSFPNGLQVASASVQDALLPMMPGALIDAKFFAKGSSYVNQYPGVMFADYLALRLKRGNLALYSQHGNIVQPALIGYERAAADSPDTKITHRYNTWIAVDKAWTSPQVIMRVGEEYKDTILAYRTDNGIDQYKPLTQKLGKLAPAYFASPMYKLDMAVLHQKFTALKSAVIDKINVPGMIHFVVFQFPSHDNGYPDFVPPDPKWGTTAEFADLVSYIHSKGGLAVPYTNLSWWDSNGATVLNLPAGADLAAIAVKTETGLPTFETYGPNSGVVVDLHSDFVKSKITEQHTRLIETLGMDGVFEDQFGVRNSPNDFNTAGLTQFDPATSYFEGVIDHYHDHASSSLFTESGVDVLAKDGVGFMGSNYLWDILGYRSATAPLTTYYPMAGMMLRDKVLLYQHDLAAETWTKNKDMLRWNLAQGYNLSNAFYDQAAGRVNVDNPWLNLVGVFQKYALANYADELVASFGMLPNQITHTTFATYQVYANWNAKRPYTINGNTLPPGGVVTQANDGSVIAGVFTRFNGKALSDGDHYLVQVSTADGVKVFQPVGPDTSITIKIKSAAGAKANITAHKYDGTPIAAVTAVQSSTDITFNYAGTVNGETVGYYLIKP